MRLVKTLLGTAFAIPSVVVPLTTLSSCGQNWGVLTPFTIGSSQRGNDPYSDLLLEYHDYDKKDMLDYLQSNYTVDQKNSTAYAYSQPMKFVDDEEKKQEDQDQWFPASSGWYQSGDADFVTTAVDKYIDDEGNPQSQNVTNAQNSALSYNVTLVSSIASTINTYLINALSYQASQISVKDLAGKNLQTAWGADSKAGFELEHGSKTEDKDKNNTFYEYNFALANLNAGGAVKAMLKTSSVNFTFQSMPFPSYNLDGTTSKITDFSGMFKSLLEKNYSEGLIYYTKFEEKTDKDEKPYKVYFYDSVPVLVNVKGITETYLDPSNKSNSFLVSDYYSTKDDITKAVGSSWKNLKEFVSDDYKTEPHFKSFDLTTSENKSFSLPTEKVDFRIPNEVNGNQFVALLSYQIIKYDGDDHSKDTASLTGIQNIFPAYFLDLFKDEYTLFKKANDQEGSGYIIDQNEINKITVLFRQLFERTAGEGLLPIEKINSTSKNLLAFLGYMFCNTDDQKTVDTSFITTTDI